MTSKSVKSSMQYLMLQLIGGFAVFQSGSIQQSATILCEGFQMHTFVLRDAKRSSRTDNLISSVLPPERNQDHVTPRLDAATLTVEVPSIPESFILGIQDSKSQVALHSACRRPSKALSIGVEFGGANGLEQASNALTNMELQTLSMQLRKSAKASTIWTSDVRALREFSSEQSSSFGDFPGPCPVVYCGKVTEVDEDILQMPNSPLLAFVLNVGDIESLTNTDFLAKMGESGVAAVWKIDSLQDVNNIKVAGGITGKHDIFWIDSTQEDISIDLKSVVAEIREVSSSAAIVASVPAMMTNESDSDDTDLEVDMAKNLKQLGCTSVVVRSACVGDGEDLEYSCFVVNAMTSKRSSEFKMTGLTGSVNGHFGGVQEQRSNKWKRRQQ